MFLRRLILKDVKAITELELPFVTSAGEPRKWTLILGENGCGKSTVLRSIALLLAGSQALPELLEDPQTWIHVGREEAVLHADLATAKGEERTLDLVIRRGDKTRDVFDRNRETLDAIDSALAHAPRNYLTIGYGVSRRLSSDTSSIIAKTGGFRNARAQSVATLFSPDAVLNPLEAWATDLHYRRGKEALDLIENALAGLLPGVTFVRIDRRQRQLMFETPDGMMPLSQLSDGYQNVAAWCGDLLYRITETFSDYKDPLSARGLLLVDEVDLHLHPVWQRQLMSFLSEKFPNFQIVATTHSPLTAHQAGEGELFTLRRESPGSAPTIFAYPGAPRNLLLQQLLTSPVFGVSSVYSQPVELKRNEYQDLKTRPNSRRTRDDKKRLTELKRELEDMPNPAVQTPLEQKQQELLERIEQALQPGNGASQRTTPDGG